MVREARTHWGNTVGCVLVAIQSRGTVTKIFACFLDVKSEKARSFCGVCSLIFQDRSCGQLLSTASQFDLLKHGVFKNEKPSASLPR